MKANVDEEAEIINPEGIRNDIGRDLIDCVEIEVDYFLTVLSKTIA
jgi:hypothetical protein